MLVCCSGLTPSPVTRLQWDCPRLCTFRSRGLNVTRNLLMSPLDACLLYFRRPCGRCWMSCQVQSQASQSAWCFAVLCCGVKQSRSCFTEAPTIAMHIVRGWP